MNNHEKAINSLIENGYEFKFQQYINDGFALYKRNAFNFSLYYLIVFAISIFAGFVIPYLGYAVDFFITPVFAAGAYLVANEVIKGNRPEFNYFFKGFDFFGPIVVLTFVSAILIILGLVLLIVPGIYLMVAYSFAAPFVVFLKKDYWTALELSRKIITKQWWLFFGFVIVLGMINLLGLLFCGIGVIVTAPLTLCMVYCAFEDIVGSAIRNHSPEQEDSSYIITNVNNPFD